jgi:hypothetical protein
LNGIHDGNYDFGESGRRLWRFERLERGMFLKDLKNKDRRDERYSSVFEASSMVFDKLPPLVAAFLKRKPTWCFKITLGEQNLHTEIGS